MLIKILTLETTTGLYAAVVKGVVRRLPSVVGILLLTITTCLFHLYRNYCEFIGMGGGPPIPIFLGASNGDVRFGYYMEVAILDAGCCD